MIWWVAFKLTNLAQENSVPHLPIKMFCLPCVVLGHLSKIPTPCLKQVNWIRASQKEPSVYFATRTPPPPHGLTFLRLFGPGKSSQETVLKVAALKDPYHLFFSWVVTFANSLAYPLNASPKDELLQMLATCNWALARAIELSDNAGVLFNEDDACEYHGCILLHLQTTQWLAGYFWAQRIRIFKLRPKHHYLWHLACDARSTLINPSVFVCFDEESFLGKVKAIASRCHGSSMTRRVFQRYLLAFALFLQASKRGEV